MSFGASFPGFKLRLTRWGGVFLVAALVLGAAAVNTGNNALMALLGLALACYVVSGTWSRQVLASVTAAVHPCRDIFAGRPALLEIELDNRSRLFPAYGVVVRDARSRMVAMEPVVAPRRSRRRTVTHTFDRRGWVDLGGWRLEVLLPLGFFVKSKQPFRARRLLVYPRLLDRAARASRGDGGSRSPRALDARGREGEVTQLRDFQDGDERRMVHWKQSARHRRLIVVDRQRQRDTPAFLVLDPAVSDPDDPGVRARFEQLVSEVATAVVERLQRGESVGVVVGDAVVGPCHGPGQMAQLLRPLAEVQPQRIDPARRRGPSGGELYRLEPA